jgi:glycosyltransferase involved in cell wall biosynthesis
MKRGTSGVYWYHYLWQTSLTNLARRLHSEVGFDLSHQLTFGSFRYPGSLWKLDVPFVLGPVGGAEEIPLAFWRDFGAKGMLGEALRVASNRLALLDPLVRRTYRNADAVLAVSPQTAAYVKALPESPERVLLIPQSGVSPQEVFSPDTRGRLSASGPVRVLFVGRLVHWKGAHLAVDAFAAALGDFPNMELTILGQGPAEATVADRVSRAGLAGAVTHIPRLPELNDVFELYRNHDIFLFPSLHDSGGMAPLEAMAAGLPVVCADTGGPAASVTESTGMKIQCEDPVQFAAEAGKALVRLAQNPELRAQMGQAGRERMTQSHYAWNVKAKELSAVYRTVASN